MKRPISIEGMPVAQVETEKPIEISGLFRSNKGGTCKIRSAVPVAVTYGGKAVSLTGGEKGPATFETRSGRTYLITVQKRS